MTVVASPTTGRVTRALAGTGTLLAFQARRDRVKIPVWVGGLGLFVAYVSAAVPQIAPRESDLGTTAVLFRLPVGRMLTGPAYGLEAPTYERFFASGYGLYFGIIAALMNIMLVVRHTRLEEQTGRSELVRAGAVGRYAGLTATLLLAVVTNVLAALVVSGAAVASEYPAAGSWLFGAGVGAGGLAFAGIAAVAAQVSTSARAAAGLSGAVLGAAFLVRAGGDTPREGGTALSWFSPLAWAQQTAPFVLDRWWPLAIPCAVAAVLVALAYVLQARRDHGAGVLGERRGRAEAAWWLGTPLGLAFRLQRGNLLGWGAGLVLAGVVDGAFAQAMIDAGDTLPEAFRDVLGADAVLDGYLAFIALFVGYLAAAYGVSAVLLVRTEELRGRADTVLATPTSRQAWFGAHVVVAVLGVVVLLLLAGAAAGLAAAAVTGQAALVGTMVAAHLNLVPGVLVVVALAVALAGVAPRLVAPVAWSAVGVVVFVGNFGSLLELPEALVALSPLSHLAQLPVESFALVPALVLLLLAAGGIAVGLWGVRRREINR